MTVQAKEKDPCSPLKKRTPQTLLEEGPFKGHRLKDSYSKLKEKPISDLSTTSGRSINDWTIIYISQDGTALSAEPDYSNEVFRKTKPRSQPALGNKSNDIGILLNALTTLLMDRVNLQALALKLGVEITDPTDNRSILMTLFDTKSSMSRANFDFNGAIFWWKASRIVHNLSSPEQIYVLDDLLRATSKDLRTSIDAHGFARERCTSLNRSLEMLRSFQKRTLHTLNDRRRALRIKMWYVSDVRHSAAYEDALNVTRALRAMASSSRMKQPGSISTWARHRLRNSLGTDRSESQTLEILTAHKDHGGLSKLADEQIDLTSKWLTRNSIENFCKGEERIHRFCFEVQKCVNKLAGANLIESPVLWSSRLFEREKSMFNMRPSRSSNHDQPYKPMNDDSSWSSERFISPQGPQISWSSSGAPSTTIPSFNMNRANEAWSSAKMSVTPSFTELGSQSRLKYSSSISPIPFPLQTHQTSTPLGSGPICNTLPEEVISAKTEFTQHIKKILGGLLISDLGFLLWVHGAETDAWVKLYSSRQIPPLSETDPKESKSEVDANTLWPRLSLDAFKTSNFNTSARQESNFENSSSQLLANSLPSPTNGTPQKSHPVPFTADFPYNEAYKTLLDRFSYSLDPYKKLNILFELQRLVSTSLDEQSGIQLKGSVTESRMKKNSDESTPASNRAMNVPRTKATSLEEVIANCTERRMNTLKFKPFTEGKVKNSQSDATSSSPFRTDYSIVLALRNIFRDPSLRPATLFRDLQFIAAFVPSFILDHTSQGTAFWDTGLAALALKDELCASMVTRATEITSYHINGPQVSPPISPSLATTNLRDAAQLWLLAAKEGSPVAARELGLFYLTHPELLPLVTFPGSKAKDVFRATLTNDRGVGGSGGRGGNFGGGAGGGLGASTGVQPGGLDPWTFAVVFHWMEVAANGGDKDASDFLRGNGELSGGR